jgi:hypothetical protein
MTERQYLRKVTEETRKIKNKLALLTPVIRGISKALNVKLQSCLEQFITETQNGFPEVQAQIQHFASNY